MEYVSGRAVSVPRLGDLVPTDQVGVSVAEVEEDCDGDADTLTLLVVFTEREADLVVLLERLGWDEVLNRMVCVEEIEGHELGESEDDPDLEAVKNAETVELKVSLEVVVAEEE